MSGRRQDDLERLLDADRGEFGAIYDRLARAEPPRRLDRAILAEASRVALGPRAPRAQRWLLGLGSAAGLVLAAGIAWQVGREMESKQADIPTGAAQQQTPAVVPVQPIAPTAAPVQQPPPPPAIAPPTRSESADREAKSTLSEADRARRVQRAEAAKLKPEPAPTAPPPPPPPPPAASAPVPAAAPAFEQSAPAAKADALHEAAPMFDAQQESRAADIAPERDADATAGGSRAQKTAAPRERTPGAPSTSVQLRSNMQLAPADWIAEIHRLVDAGRHQQAVENLRLFRRLHPDWPLDEDLRRLDR